jgi:hypothetical protein
MVSPTSPTPSDLPDPFEPEKEEAEPEVPAEIVAENLPIPEPEKELEDFDISIIENPSGVETATTEIATEALQIETPEKEEPPQEIEEAEAPEVTEVEGTEFPSEPPSIEAESPEEIEEPEAPEVTEVEGLDDEENELEPDEIEEENADISSLEELDAEEVDLTNAEVEEAEELEEEDAELEDVEDEEEEDLNLITNAISDDYVDPNGQEFKKLLEEILPFDDTMHILPKEKLESAAHFFDLEHKVFYTHKPLHQKDLTPFRNTFLQLDLTEEEIRAIKITRVPLSQWESFIHKLKNHN